MHDGSNENADYYAQVRESDISGYPITTVMSENHRDERKPETPWAEALLQMNSTSTPFKLVDGGAIIGAGLIAAATVWAQWALLNVGHAGVIAGTLAGSLGLLVAGTALYDAAVAWLGLAVRGGQSSMWLIGYRISILAMLASSLAGLAFYTFGK